jgi:hypothetical protein
VLPFLNGQDILEALPGSKGESQPGRHPLSRRRSTAPGRAARVGCRSPSRARHVAMSPAEMPKRRHRGQRKR